MTDWITINSPISMDIFVDEISKRESKDYPFVVFEIGSRDGTDARELKRQFPNSDVYAFEASPEEYELFTAENKHIHWINKAIYNENKIIDFNLKDFYSGVHSIRNRLNYGYRQQVIQVEAIRVDEYCAATGLDHIDIVKIDVEGCTYEVLESFGKILPTVRFLHIETEREEYFEGQKLEDEVFTFLRENNFDMIMNNVIMGLKQSDSIWMKV